MEHIPRQKSKWFSQLFIFGTCNVITGLVISLRLGWISVAFVWTQKALEQGKVFIIISTMCGPSILANSHSGFWADFLPEDPSVFPFNLVLILMMTSRAGNQISRQNQICSLKGSQFTQMWRSGGIFVLQVKSGKWWELLSSSERPMTFVMVRSLQPHLAAHWTVVH